MEIQAHCPHCKTLQSLAWGPGQPLPQCPGCNTPWLDHLTEKLTDQCPMCGAAHLYRLRDFNRKLGVALVVIGVALAFFTYGLSLLVVTVLDWLLYKRVKEVASCYRCGVVFRDHPRITEIEPFNLELLDYYRNLKN